MLDPAESEKWNSLERRVEHLEEDMTDVKASLRSIESKVDSLVEEVRRRSERELHLPITDLASVTRCPHCNLGAGAAIIAAAVRFRS